jgi:AcrR family transcriptional regulator
MWKTDGMTQITQGTMTMGWQDFYRRRDALNAAIDQGEVRASDAFPDERELLLALHHRWAQRLTARVELAELDYTDDLVDAVGNAWRRTVSDNARLRALLDEHADNPALRPLIEAEHRMLARVAGLTEAGDSPEEEASIGAAFVALQKSAPDERPRRNPVERLLRRLAPSA